ncbi:3-dehydroquinate synthase family protein [Micromonospora sp. NPDC006766]|uniref:3-dehydroquinate synthase n=1 Tax=Micromonospora sp. NPDC006766 TaxID=3154778 RepID=UPI003411C036
MPAHEHQGIRRSRLASTSTPAISVSVEVFDKYPITFRERYEPQAFRTVIDPIRARLQTNRTVVVSDSNVGPIIGKRLASDLRGSVGEVDLLIFPAGETSKDVGRLVDLWSSFKELGIERRDLVIGVGGGVVCDIAGLVASTYLRGLPYVLVPTSLMAQVDAAIGGKVGADFLGSKNWIGGFYHPSAVLSYAEHLDSLSDDEFACGFAEIVKVALIQGGELWADVSNCTPRSLRESRARLQRVVRASALAKLDLLAADPLELSTLDRSLNLGHCFGHAIESASSFQLRHGEAVALGTTIAARVGYGRALCSGTLVSTVEGLLSAFGLPTVLPPSLLAASWIKVADLRKVRNGALRLVVPAAPGRTVFVDDVTYEEFAEAAGHG